MTKMKRVIPFLLSSLVVLPQVISAQEDQPNIVLVFMDNFGWGESVPTAVASFAVRLRPRSTGSLRHAGSV